MAVLANQLATGRPWRRRVPASSFVIVYVLLLLCIPSQLIFGPLGAPGTPANLWAIFCLLWWSCATIGGLNEAPRRSPVRVAAAVFAVAVTLSYASATAQGWLAQLDVRQSTDPVYDLVPVQVASLQPVMRTAADRGLLSVMGWMGIVLLTMDGVRSWQDMERIFRWVAGACAYVASLGILQFFTGIDIAGYYRIPLLVANQGFGDVVSRSIFNRVQGTATHPIEFGVVVAGLFPLALHRLIYNGRQWQAWLPTILIGVAIPFSISRSAILVFGVAYVVLWLGWSTNRRVGALIVLPAALVGMRLAVPGLVGTIRSLFDHISSDPSVTGRTDDYAVLAHVYLQHMWLGRGVFTFVPRYYRIVDNEFLLILIELGAVGLAAVGLFYTLALASARGASVRARDPRARHLARVLLASLGGVLASYLTFDAWGFPMAAGVTFLLVGLCGATWNLTAREQAD